MRTLPPGWETDLAVLRHSGSIIEDRGDHLVVRSPHSPHFHWGNCVFITDPALANDVEGCLDRFHAAHPYAPWVSIGLIQAPAERTAWIAKGLEIEDDDVLTTSRLPRLTQLPPGYTVRRLGGDDDWGQSVARAIAENDQTHEHESKSFADFARDQVRARRAMSDRGVAAFFGAFTADADTLVADLGIVRCGPTARYQSVGTDVAHRRRGLAAHLLGVAAQWSAEQGCGRWVIITEATNPAGRVYRSVGFEPDIGNAQAYRRPPNDISHSIDVTANHSSG